VDTCLQQVAHVSRHRRRGEVRRKEPAPAIHREAPLLDQQRQRLLEREGIAASVEGHLGQAADLADQLRDERFHVGVGEGLEPDDIRRVGRGLRAGSDDQERRVPHARDQLREHLVEAGAGPVGVVEPNDDRFPRVVDRAAHLAPEIGERSGERRHVGQAIDRFRGIRIE